MSRWSHRKAEEGPIPLSYRPDDSQPCHYRGPQARTRDDWGSIGDLGHVNADGYVHLAHRRDDRVRPGSRCPGGGDVKRGAGYVAGSKERAFERPGGTP
ncbi:MAG: hypothetical protein QOG20_5619 [Pseudonocardiales bacterium]|nr:hypothetical protein [Pseudonocardiales bacterium]